MSVAGDLFRAAWADYRRHGLAIIPANQNKEPLVRGWGKWHGPPTRDTLARFADRFPTSNIAILTGLSRLIVIDIDDPDLTREMWQRFGPTPLIGQSPSGGRHLFYNGRCKSTDLRAENLDVDIKSLGGIVLAPPSRRPQGVYEFLSGSIDDFARLPAIRLDGLPTPKDETEAREPFRNKTLFKVLRPIARQFAEEDFALFLAEARAIASTYRPPEEDYKVVATAKSVWKWRLKHPRGAWKVNHTLIDTADAIELPGDALKLLIVLKAAHENDTGRGHDGFVISPSAMWRSSTIPGWSDKAYAKARDLLIDAGKLIVIQPPQPHRAGVYRFADVALGGASHGSRTVPQADAQALPARGGG
jgi:hypothetical protein